MLPGHEPEAAAGDSALTSQPAPSASNLAFGVTTDENDSAHISEYLHPYVVVACDGKPYPGKVVDIDEQLGELHTSCMHRVGPNRFFWPTRTDVCWYIVAVIPEPTKVTQRHCEVSAPIWREVMKNV